ncbi:MAG: 4Fe-4S binding protein [Geminocystis sp.]|nr:4Fe-4S binding protein [Geminocystis sp.]HIK36656.1 4Fe-4S binding protein [Geminocystis sp. M7585_C2015_104]MCS7147224.1 4Fe-4S binding protein [Geminocystis sp.]MCX8078551.1 4Fe-4S binding protein [Geminocystis sp.]MDW8116220.1 LdpA C-terminal domain-containing domain [Geminocystis sp.]
MYSSPIESLKRGSWVKLICGASYQHLPFIRNLALIYTLAGVDCIDVAAYKAVILAALEGIEVALDLQPSPRPFLMISINDGEDPHFRKASFNSNLCPPDCHRPCQTICPAGAINFLKYNGIHKELCYGCGRCLPVCPIGIIDTESHIVSAHVVLKWLDELPIDAIEIHTQQGHWDRFTNLWQTVRPYLAKLKLIAISCPYANDVISYLRQIHQYVQPVTIPLIWQTDGRPMSGDIGEGTTHLTIKYAQQVRQLNLKGFIQLAGGTNEHTITKLKSLNLIPAIAGIAYGSKARRLVYPILQKLEETTIDNKLEKHPSLLWEAVRIARQLVSPLKQAVLQER